MSKTLWIDLIFTLLRIALNQTARFIFRLLFNMCAVEAQQLYYALLQVSPPPQKRGGFSQPSSNDLIIDAMTFHAYIP